VRRDAIRSRYLEFQRMSPREQARIRKNYERYRHMPIDRRQELREKYRQMTPDQRHRLREKMRDRAIDRPTSIDRKN